MGRLVTDIELAQALKQHRQRGETIVTTNGGFDILHTGHLHLLREAKKQGDVLVVGLNSDRSVKMSKGDTRPFNSENDRAEMLCALSMVDYVVLFDEKDCIDFVRRVKPDVHVNDSDYGENCIERAAVLEGGGRLHIVQKVAGRSTTDFARRIARVLTEGRG